MAGFSSRVTGKQKDDDRESGVRRFETCALRWHCLIRAGGERDPPDVCLCELLIQTHNRQPFFLSQEMASLMTNPLRAVSAAAAVDLQW